MRPIIKHITIFLYELSIKEFGCHYYILLPSIKTSKYHLRFLQIIYVQNIFTNKSSNKSRRNWEKCLIPENIGAIKRKKIRRM